MAPQFVGETVNPDESPLDRGDFRGVDPVYQNYANDTDKPGDVLDSTVTVVKTKEQEVTAVGTLPNKDGAYAETFTTEVPALDRKGEVKTEEVDPSEAAAREAQAKDPANPDDPAKSSQPDPSATTGLTQPEPPKSTSTTSK